MATFTISKRAVDSAPVGTYYDNKLPGFGLRVGASGSRSYFVEYRPRRGRSVPKRRMTFAEHGGQGMDSGRCPRRGIATPWGHQGRSGSAGRA